MMDYSNAAKSVADTIAKSGEPLTETQRTMLAGAMAVWLDKAAAVERERCAKLCEDMRSEPTPYQGELEYRVSEKAYEVAQECAAAIRGA